MRIDTRHMIRKIKIAIVMPKKVSVLRVLSEICPGSYYDVCARSSWL